MIKLFDDPSNERNSISGEEMLILQAKILASIANLVKNSNLLEILPPEQLMGNPKEEALERLHHYYYNALKNKSGFEITSTMEKEISSIPHQTDKEQFIGRLFNLVHKEQPLSIECKAYLMQLANCFGTHQAANYFDVEEVKEAVVVE